MGDEGSARRWTRRAFIATGTLVGGGLLIGAAGFALAPNRFGVRPERDAPQPTTWVKITSDDRVIVLVPHAEMGQGTHTALAMMLAEELDADWARVEAVHAPVLDEYANAHIVRAFLAGKFDVPESLERGLDYVSYRAMKGVGMQITGGSTGVRGTGQYGMRVAGAAAREMLVATAAARWSVPETECATAASRVTHRPSGRSYTYGELATDAARLEPPVHPRLKPRAEWKIVGTPRRRFDVPAKTEGRARFAVDVRLPGLLYASIASAPVHGGTLESVDPAPALQRAGVRRVVRLDDAVAVVAESWWTANEALKALAPRWSDGGHGNVDDATLLAAQREAIGGGPVTSDGAAPETSSPIAARVLDVEYRVPYLAHAALEPMSATVRIADGRCEIWTGIQDPLRSRALAADVLGFEREQVTVHNELIGGGFGRRLPNEGDFLEQAVRIARELQPAPVQLVWSREQDITHGYYRPAVLARLRAELHPDGRPRAWTSRFTGRADGGAATPHYAVDSLDVESRKAPAHVRTGYWRSVDHSQHGFFVESFVDELAHAAGRDPFEYRRDLLRAAPRQRAVLERAARMAGWGPALPSGRGRGIAVVESYGSAVAVVVEVEQQPDMSIRVTHAWAAVDCGAVINPEAAHAQVEGGVLFGLSAALGEGLTIAQGRVVQSNYHDYPLLRLRDAPPVTVEFVDSDAAPGGLGEPGLPPVAPALANAVYVATGRRVRELPLSVALKKA
jgi:isoquinoline 1-oxidoreductase beta subunit